MLISDQIEVLVILLNFRMIKINKLFNILLLEML